MIEGALKADGRIAAKNAVKIRAALRELADYKKLYLQYQETMPESSGNLARDRTRARAWAIMNVTQLRTEALASSLWRMWAEAYVLGTVAADEWLRITRELNKADDDVSVDWDNWKPGDRAATLLLQRPKAFQQILDSTNVTIRGLTQTSITDIGNSLAEAIDLGLDASSAALLISRNVASPARALTIAITEQNRVISAATMERYKEAGLEKQEWAVSDPCDICAKNDGVIVPIGTSFPSGDTQPPAHPHCRCVLLPVIPGMEEDDPMGIDGGITPMPDGAAIVETPLEVAPTTQNSNPRNIEAELAKMFEETEEMGEFKNKAIMERLQDMDRKDLALGGSEGDNQLKIIAEMQGFDGKPQLVETIEELIAKQNADGGKVVWRGLSDYSKDVEDGILEAVPKISYTAQQGVDEFMTGDYRGGWGSFGSGTYSTIDMSDAMGYARGVSEGQMGNGQTIAMLIPSNANMPTKEVVKATYREVVRGQGAFGGAYNMGRALAAKGYQAYDVGFMQDDKAGIYVILDRSMLTVAKETRK
jgi:SPP1 gp7 family putative phage head morphogenesis protein